MKKIVFKCDFCSYEETHELGGNTQFPRVLMLIGNMEACRECMIKAQALLENKITPIDNSVTEVYAKNLKEKIKALEDIEMRNGHIIKVEGMYPNFIVTLLPHSYEDN